MKKRKPATQTSQHRATSGAFVRLLTLARLSDKSTANGFKKPGTASSDLVNNSKWLNLSRSNGLLLKGDNLITETENKPLNALKPLETASQHGHGLQPESIARTDGHQGQANKPAGTDHGSQPATGQPG